MRKVNLYEFKDLTKDIQKKVLAKTLNEIVERDIETITGLLNKGLIAEKEYYDRLGCSKNYAETTTWFVPSCYYEKHKKEVDREAEKVVETELYTDNGRFVMLI